MSSPTYAPDLAERTRYIVEHNLPPGIYHAANAGVCTWCGFASDIFRRVGKNVKIIPVSGEKFPRPAKRPRFSALLNTKLPPMRPWQESLQEYLNS
jgi:dTDP-4-dehydrorhamnose reductase